MPGILKNNFFTGKQKPYNAVQHLCTVKFLDNSDPISVTYERDTKGRFLVDHVCSSIDLIERDYFGLKYTDADKQECWLDPEKTIHSQIKGLSNSVLYFQIKFYPSDLDAVKEEITRYQLFLQVRKDFNESRLICSLQDALQLSAYVVQDEIGDYDNVVDLESHVAQVKIPTALMGYEEEIMNIHKQLKGLGQSDAEYKFLKKAASLCSYGIDPYIVSDKSGEAMYLAISPKGIITIQDNVPVKTYKWEDVLKLSFDGKTFHIKSSCEEKKSGNGFQNVKSHIGVSLFACTSVNKKPSHQSTDTYKCLSHANCKQLWKNAVAHKYFYTLQSSSEAPKVLTSGGLFTRGSKFRYSGNCLEEIRRSSASINREEPRVSRRLSSVQSDKDGGCSTLPHGWKHSTSVGEEARRAAAVVSEQEESFGPSRRLESRTSSDSFLEKSPTTADLSTPELVSTGGRGHVGAVDRDVEIVEAKPDAHDSNRDALPCGRAEVAPSPSPSSPSSASIDAGGINGSVEKTGGDEVDDDDDAAAAAAGGDGDDDDDDDDDVDGDVSTTDDVKQHGALSEPSPQTALCDSTDLSETCSSFDVTCDESNDSKEGACPGRGRNEAAASGKRSGAEHVPEENERKTRRDRQESGSGYDTGYLSSGSERLSRSFEGDEAASTVRSRGILEEMEFPLTPDDLPAAVEGFAIEAGAAAATPDASAHSPLRREELLSLLAYGRENAGAPDAKDGPEHETIARTSLEAPTACGNRSGFFSPPSPVDDRGRTADCPSPGEPLPSQLSPGRLMSGVFSSDNFKRIKEIEKMIEDNKSKILLMKEAISSEIKRSGRSKPVDPSEAQPTTTTTTPEGACKQPKHVSFSTHDAGWRLGRSGAAWESLRSRSSRCSFGDCDVDAVGPGTAAQSSLCRSDGAAHDVVTVTTTTMPSSSQSSDGTLVAEAELCRISDGSGDSSGSGSGDGDGGGDCTESSSRVEATDAAETLEVFRSEGSGGFVCSSFSLPQATGRRQTLLETKVENFTFSETVVEEVVKVTPELLEALSMSLHGSSAMNPSCSDAVDAPACSGPPITSEEFTEQVSSVEEKCTASKEFVQVSYDGEGQRAQSGYETVARSGSFRRGLGLSLLSVSVLSIIVFVAFLIVVFELNQEIPYVTDQEAIVELKRSVYDPARERLMRLFQE